MNINSALVQERMGTAPFKKGDLVRRLIYGQANDSRLFVIVMVNERAINGGVFSARSADGGRGDWGGAFPEPYEFEVVKEAK